MAFWGKKLKLYKTCEKCNVTNRTVKKEPCMFGYDTYCSKCSKCDSCLLDLNYLDCKPLKKLGEYIWDDSIGEKGMEWFKIARDELTIKIEKEVLKLTNRVKKNNQKYVDKIEKW